MRRRWGCISSARLGRHSGIGELPHSGGCSRLNSLLLKLLLPLLQFLQELLWGFDLLLSILLLLLLLVVARGLIVRLIGLIIGRVIGGVGRVIGRIVLSLLRVLTFNGNGIRTRSCHRHCRRPIIDSLVVGSRLLDRWLRSCIGWSA